MNKLLLAFILIASLAHAENAPIKYKHKSKFVTKTMASEAWVWRQMWMGSISDGLSDFDLKSMNDIPLDAKNIFSAGSYIYWRQKITVYRKITEEVHEPTEEDFLKSVVYERAKGRDTGIISDYTVSFSGDWAEIHTGGHAWFAYYYKRNSKGEWEEKNEPLNAGRVPEDAPKEWRDK